MSPQSSVMALLHPIPSKSGQAAGHPMETRVSLSPVVEQSLSAPPQLFSTAARIFVSAFESAAVVLASAAHVVTILPFRRPSSHLAKAFISACANFPDSLRIDFWHF